jgi:hypothetical protein
MELRRQMLAHIGPNPVPLIMAMLNPSPMPPEIVREVQEFIERCRRPRQ